MEELTKTQFIFLVLLVSFVTSLLTGIVTATLVNQAPPLMTQTISKVIEKMAPQLKENVAAPALSQQDLVIKAVKDASSAVVSVVATKDMPIIEQYFINPFGQDPFFQQMVPPELLPNIQVPQYRQKGVENKQVAAGTGFFVSEDGLIVTNKHVIEDASAEYWIITNNGKKEKAKVLATDPVQDIAILKIDGATSTNHNFITLGNSDQLSVGQTVIAIGNALGEFQNTVSVGVISGLHRSVIASGSASGEEILQEVIQTDAAINPGNSGGPLLDLNGNAVGIDTAMANGAENIGFALPINIVKRDVEDVKASGKIEYAYLGVRYIVINDQVKAEKKLTVDYGVLLAKGSNGEPAVIANGPGEKAGLKEGDVILEFDGGKLTQNNSLASLISRKHAGDKVPLKIIRGNQTINISVTLESRPGNL